MKSLQKLFKRRESENSAQSDHSEVVPIKCKHTYYPIRPLGKGSFGSVSLALTKQGDKVAVKRINVNPRTKNRELSIWKSLNSPYCVKLLDSATKKDKNTRSKEIFMVMEYIPETLSQYITRQYDKETELNFTTVKKLAYQIFAGLNYMHSHGITHRDIKPQNLLVDEEKMELKLCDFGSSKKLKSNEESVSYIASRYYRAPELILGCKRYTSAIDIWAAGCVIAEMFNNGQPLFTGADSLSLMKDIVNIIGAPTNDELASFPHINQPIPSVHRSCLEDAISNNVPEDLMELLSLIFVYDPSKRPTASECLKHRCFVEFNSNQKNCSSRSIFKKCNERRSL